VKRCGFQSSQCLSHAKEVRGQSSGFEKNPLSKHGVLYTIEKLKRQEFQNGKELEELGSKLKS